MPLEKNTSNILIRLPEVRAIVPFSRSTIYSLIAKGEFPAPVKLGSRASAWVKAEVVDWAENRIAKRQSV